MAVQVPILKDVRLLLTPLSINIFNRKSGIFSMKTMQRGFTLLEIMLSLTMGVVVLAGVLSVFVGVKTTTTETASYGELQENGRFALNMLTDDLRRQSFWGDLSGNLHKDVLNGIPPAPSGDCAGAGPNNATFPNNNSDYFRSLWGDTVTSALIADTKVLDKCLTDALVGSDVIQIKRVLAQPYTEVMTASTPPILRSAALVDKGFYYLISSGKSAEIFSTTAVPALTNGRVWQYQHRIYYVKDKSSSDNIPPVLMRSELKTTGTKNLSFSPLVDGIERIRFLYGVDTSNNGIVNAYLSADQMDKDYWGGGSNPTIISVKVYVLVKSLNEDPDYDNKNEYLLGDVHYSPQDNFRRLLVSTTVTLYNSMLDSKS